MNGNYDPVSRKFLCECGCGEEVSDPSRSFRLGHYTRTLEEGPTAGMYLGPRPEEVRERISKSAKKYYEDGGVNGMEGKLHSSESRDRMSKSQREYWDSEEGLEQRKRLSELHTGEFWSAEERKNHSRLKLAYYESEEGKETKKQISESQYGCCHTAEENEKASESLKKFWASEEGVERREKWSRERQGEGGQNWKGGFDYGYGYGWDSIREAILVRDERICQSCGSKFNLVVHHIDGTTWNVVEKNLITVCQRCNMRASSKYEEGYLREFFTNRIAEIYSCVNTI